MKTGYNKIAKRYGATRRDDSEDVGQLQLLTERLPKGAVVLDAGCGSGEPVTRLLARSFRVTGVDFSEEQMRLAKETVPDSEVICADITRLPFQDCSFDAVCSFYTIIHVPRSEHHELLLGLRRILRPEGLALLCMGAGDLPDQVDEYHAAEMFWSHYDSETNMMMIKKSGFSILRFTTIVDPTDSAASHLFVLAQKAVILPIRKFHGPFFLRSHTPVA